MKPTVLKVTDFIGNKAYFSFYRAGNLYYIIRNKENNNFYSFPVPIEDTNGATFSRDEKGITLMRWIRKAIDGGMMVFYQSNQGEADAVCDARKA
jgi:hypothetical protein